MVFLIAGCALMVVAAGMFAWHPLLNLMIEPEVVRRVDGAEVWVIDDDDLTPLYNELEANWDGTLSEFVEDYYVAHDWSDYGAYDPWHLYHAWAERVVREDAAERAREAAEDEVRCYPGIDCDGCERIDECWPDKSVLSELES